MENNNYLKLPNQGNIASNLRLLYEIKNAIEYADDNGFYTKSDIAEIAANSLLVTSGNKLGNEVIDRIRNRGIDEGDNSPLQNTKMRMQLLRILGLVSADYNSEIYAITEIGDLITSSKISTEQKKKLLRELFMSISTSSESYDFTCNEGYHCFIGLQICYALASLDYKIAVDEMPIITTYDYRDVDIFVKEASSYREKNKTFPNTHIHFPKTKNGKPLSQVTNITRTINQILRYCQIIEPKLEKLDNRNYYVCTKEGRAYVDKIRTQWDNNKIILKIPFEFRKANILDQKNLVKQGLDNILIRAGIIEGKDTGLYFSPYQMIPETNVSWLMGSDIRKHPQKSNNKIQAINSSLSTRDLRLKAIYKKNSNNNNTDFSTKDRLILEMKKCMSLEDKKKFISNQIRTHKQDDKNNFYPYIHTLLKIIGLDCKGEVTRYQKMFLTIRKVYDRRLRTKYVHIM